MRLVVQHIFVLICLCTLVLTQATSQRRRKRCFVRLCFKCGLYVNSRGKRSIGEEDYPGLSSEMTDDAMQHRRELLLQQWTNRDLLQMSLMKEDEDEMYPGEDFKDPSDVFLSYTSRKNDEAMSEDVDSHEEHLIQRGRGSMAWLGCLVILTLYALLVEGRSATCEELSQKKMKKSNLLSGSFISLGWPPEFQTRPIGSTARFVCSHIGFRGGDPAYSPEVELHWFKDDAELQSFERVQIIGCNKKPFILGTKMSVTNLTWTDTGNYSCKLWMNGDYPGGEVVFEDEFSLKITGGPGYAWPSTSGGIDSTYTTVHNLNMETQTEKFKIAIYLVVPLAFVFTLCLVFLHCFRSRGAGSKSCFRHQMWIPCKRIFRSIKGNDSSQPELSVCFRRDRGTEPTSKAMESTILVTYDEMNEDSKNFLCKKYSAVFPFITEMDVNEIMKFEIHRERLQCNLEHRMPIILGTGNFGQVYSGTILNSKGAFIPVAVKRLNDGSNPEELGNFLREVLTLMKAGQHINVISLIATIVLDTLEGSISGNNLLVQRPPILVMELATGGNLRKFLHDNRFNFVPSKEKNPIPYSPNQTQKSVLEIKNLLSFAYQVGRGMEHLSKRNILHRDLAARNVLLTDQLVIKIADFGLSKFMTDSKQYYRVSNQGITPAKWTAPESLWSNKFTVKSDVWSFGILLWEILTLGDQPYSYVPACKLYEYLSTGNRLKRPLLASFEMYETMLMCWSWDPKLRPDFTVLVERMDEILLNASNQPYMDLANARPRLSGCSAARHSDASISYSSMTETTSCASTNEITYTQSTDADSRTKTVLGNGDGESHRNSGIGYEIMNPLYEGEKMTYYVNGIYSQSEFPGEEIGMQSYD